MSAPEFVYKLRRKSDGLYSNKGRYYWSEVGGAWAHAGHFKNHVRLKLGYRDQVEDYEVVRVPVAPASEVIPLAEFLSRT